MNPSLMSQLDEFARGLIPLGATLALVLLETLPLPVPGTDVAPALSLLALYFWGVYRPDLMPAAGVFAVGLLLDVISGATFGVNPLVLLVVYAMVLSQRRFLVGKPLAFVWLGFALTAALAGGIHWAVASLLSNLLLDPTPLFVRLAITLAVYPLFAWLLGRMQRTAGREAEA